MNARKATSTSPSSYDKTPKGLRSAGSTEAFEVFFDGDCPLCKREVDVLAARDRARLIRFTDIAVASFDADSVGKTQQQLMAQIHGRLPNGEWIEGVEVFRQLYSAVGFNRLVALTRLPIVSHLMSVGYWLFAKNRLRLTGRSAASCTTDRCTPQKATAS